MNVPLNHECEGTKANTVDVYRTSSGSEWSMKFEYSQELGLWSDVDFAFDFRLYGIKHCPYCGEKLGVYDDAEA